MISFVLQSVALWIDYVSFVQEHDPLVQQCSPNGIIKARNLFERAVTAGGLHVTEGSRIYETYRKFEQAILLPLGEADSEVTIPSFYFRALFRCLEFLYEYFQFSFFFFPIRSGEGRMSRSGIIHPLLSLTC